MQATPGEPLSCVSTMHLPAAGGPGQKGFMRRGGITKTGRPKSEPNHQFLPGSREARLQKLEEKRGFEGRPPFDYAQLEEHGRPDLRRGGFRPYAPLKLEQVWGLLYVRDETAETVRELEDARKTVAEDPDPCHTAACSRMGRAERGLRAMIAWTDERIAEMIDGREPDPAVFDPALVDASFDESEIAP